MEEILKILETMSDDMVKMTHIIESMAEKMEEMDKRIYHLEHNNRNYGNKFTDDEDLEWVRV